MEHQTMTFVVDYGFELLAHELAHQWFGDHTTCGSWEDIWLNEGFATYLSGLAYEFRQPQFWQSFKSGRINSAISQAGGSVFVTIDPEVDSTPPDPKHCLIWVEDDGTGIPEAERVRIFDRGVRLDTDKPGTGLGLAIVRDVAEIYGGSVTLGVSEDLGGLLVELRLPRAD